MNQHLIAIDLDGTTLNNNSQLSDKTVATLRAAAKEGHIVSIVTGRPYRISAKIYDEIGLQTPMINFNGALGHIPHEEWQNEYQKTIQKEIALDLLSNRQELGVSTITAENKNHLWANQGSHILADFFPVSLKSNEILNAQNLTSNPTALTVQYQKDKKDKLVKQILAKYGDFVDVRIWGGPNDVLEIVAKGIQKARGVEYLAKTYHIDRQNIIAFGDEDNDAEMIAYAGQGVAMQNAIPSIKDVANDVTPLDNDQDGLAIYLSEYLKLAQ
jgi:Cof subfamily protein (haloacid dehalogenase superfamily)